MIDDVRKFVNALSEKNWIDGSIRVYETDDGLEYKVTCESLFVFSSGGLSDEFTAAIKSAREFDIVAEGEFIVLKFKV